jgi:hypothetical protein
MFRPTRWLIAVLRSWRHDRHPDFDEEIDAHITLEADRLIADGVAPDEARLRARLSFGNVTQARERHFESGRWMWLDHLGRDVRYALRMLRRHPASACAVILTVALAMAANSALFAIFDGLLFRPLAFPEADRIVSITVPPEVWSQPPVTINRDKLRAAFASSGLFAEYARVIDSPVFFQENTDAVTVEGLRAARLEPGLFEFLRIRPMLGRVLSPEDVGAYSPTPVMIGYDLWHTRFGGDASIVGRTIDLPRATGADADRSLVVGVMPKGFSFPRGANVWHLASDLSNQPVNIPPPNFGRLADRVTIDQVRAEFPRLVITPLREYVRPRGAWALTILLAATGLLFLVAWVQVAALLFARSAGRATELGVRLALGATRWSLTRQFGIDSLVIGVLSIVLGTSIAPGLVALVLRLLPAETTAGQTIALDHRTMMFAAALSTAGILIAALAPIEILRHTSPLGLMRNTMFERVQLSGTRTRRTLLVAQLTLTTMLLLHGGTRRK